MANLFHELDAFLGSAEKKKLGVKNLLTLVGNELQTRFIWLGVFSPRIQLYIPGKSPTHDPWNTAEVDYFTGMIKMWDLATMEREATIDKQAYGDYCREILDLRQGLEAEVIQEYNKAIAAMAKMSRNSEVSRVVAMKRKMIVFRASYDKPEPYIPDSGMFVFVKDF